MTAQRSLWDAAVDIEEGRRLKDEGQARVASNAGEWHAAAMQILLDLCRRRRFITADDFAAAAESAGLGEPHHPHARGAIWTAAARRKWIVKTGRTVLSERVKQHAASLTVWESLLY